jgi:hypothetical protein
MRRAAMAPLRGGEKAFLHGLSRSPSRGRGGGGEGARCSPCTRHPPTMGAGCASSASPSTGVRLPLRRSGPWHLGGGLERAAGSADGLGGR